MRNCPVAPLTPKYGCDITPTKATIHRCTSHPSFSITSGVLGMNSYDMPAPG